MATQTTGLLGVTLTDTPTTQAIQLGTKVSTDDNGTYLYVQANGAITQYDAVGVDENYQAASLTTAMADDGWMIGFAQVAFADNDYGWVALTGSNINVAVLASCAADTALYTTSTAGTLSSTTNTSGTKIDGVVAVVSAGTAATTTEIIATWPRSATF